MQNKSPLTSQSKPLRVLGIDPGYDRLGIAVIEHNTVIYSDCFETSRSKNHSARLVDIAHEISRIITIHQPTLLSIETLFLSNNQKTAMKVAEARGVVLCEAEKAGLALYELSPLQVKVAVTGYGKSDKSQVTFMVHKLLHLNTKNTTKKIKDDEYDALAIALAGVASYPHQRGLLQKK